MKLFLLSSLLVFTLGAQASEQSKSDTLNELLDVMNMDTMVDSMYSQMELMLQNMSSQMGVQPSEQAIFDEYYSKMTLLMRESMSWEKMKPMTIEVYQRNFNEKEIEDMLTFYKSETGQSILEKMPVVMQESMQIGQTLMQNTWPKVQAIATELEADLAESRKKLLDASTANEEPETKAAE